MEPPGGIYATKPRRVNVSLDRYRVPGGAPLRVFFFGGSTTWGLFERDSATRAAVAATRLAEAGVEAEVTKFDQQGYMNAPELLTLVFALRRGHSGRGRLLGWRQRRGRRGREQTWPHLRRG